MRAIKDHPVRSYAILGADYLGLRPALKVASGDTVRAGQVLLADRVHPHVLIVAPMVGKVTSIDYGPKRALSALIIQSDKSVTGVPAPLAPPDVTTRIALRDTLQSQGLWTAFRTRPFGRFPDPDKIPDALFVTATDSAPLAVDPRDFLADQQDDFQTGVELLALLTDGPVYVCQSAGPTLVEETPRIHNVVFDGPHPAGLASTHIQTLYPVGQGREVWTVECQDVAAIGHLARTGYHDPRRIVAVTGPGMSDPELIRTIPGASLREITGADVHSLSGSQLAGSEANWLGRFHRQITLVDRQKTRKWPALPSRLARRKQAGGLRAIIPMAALDRALPPDFLPLPLMRALSVVDFEQAERLGALSLVEEDMALLTSLCTSGANYGVLLRQVLDALEDAA